MDAEITLDLERDLPVTPADVEAQRRLRKDLPSWLDLDWRILDQCVPADALKRRAVASDAWRPFVLD